MWFGHHPFFLFLIPEIINDKLKKRHVEKQIKAEQNLLEDIRVQHTNNDELNTELKKWKRIHERNIKTGMPFIFGFFVSIFVLFICLLAEKSVVTDLLIIPSIAGALILGFIVSYCAPYLIQSGESVSRLELEIKRRKNITENE